MVLLDNYIRKCVQFALPIFSLIAENAVNIINTPLNASSFESTLLTFNWEPLSKDGAEKSDFLVDLVLKRLITDLLSGEEDDGDYLKLCIKKCSVVLDFCFHSKQYREKPTSWIIVYFELVSTIIDMLSYPIGTIEFWPYIESRMEWFKMGSSLEPLPFGSTNMISYKQPLYDKLRHWNDLLKTVQNNLPLNTPLSNIMSYKFIKFLSELLPIYEESNFNRSALISTRQNSGNPWNKTISSVTKRDNSSENIFATDYNYIFENLLTCPLDFVFRPSEHKSDLDKILSNLLDSIFETEEDFYRRVKNSHKKLMSINEKLNYGYPCEYEMTSDDQPRYLKNSSRLREGREIFWNKFCSWKTSNIDMLQPTLLDISITKPDSLYFQMTDTDNDFYRKQFILQLYFSVNMVRQIVTLPEIENFYKSCYQKERPSRSINFDNLDEHNRRRTSTFCNQILDNRINKFYHHRDPLFASLIQKLSVKDKILLRAKADGFKMFQSFQVFEHSLDPWIFDYTFKKFGFIEMGNKLINNVWKIKTGLEKIKKPQEGAKELYDSLHRKFENNSKPEYSPGEYDDKIIREWQHLRSLRSQYLFEFNKVDENVGIDGLFDASLIESQRDQKKEFFQNVLRETKQPHLLKLEEARHYIAEKRKKKRTHQEESEIPCNKKAKMESLREDEKLITANDERVYEPARAVMDTPIASVNTSEEKTNKSMEFGENNIENTKELDLSQEQLRNSEQSQKHAVEQLTNERSNGEIIENFDQEQCDPFVERQLSRNSDTL